MEQFNIVSKPGIPDWSETLPSTQLLVDYPVINSTYSVLLFGCHQGALAAYLARHLPEGQLTVTDTNLTSLETTRLTLEANHISKVNFLNDIELPRDLYQKFNAVFIQAPKGRQINRRWLVQAFNGLDFAGNLYIAGSKKTGIQSVIKDARDLFGPGMILAYKKGNRVAQFIKKADGQAFPDWIQEPGILPGSWIEFSIQFASHNLIIRSLPGLFSCDHLDEGTKMLLNVIHIPPGAKVLDVGCGYGVIGCYAAVNGAQQVDLIDNNLLAIASCRETIHCNHIPNAVVFAGDLLSPINPKKYDLILSNPPFHFGHAVDFKVAQAMIVQSFQALSPGGQFTIVANRFIRYDRLIESVFGNISILDESGKFHILSGLKSSESTNFTSTEAE